MLKAIPEAGWYLIGSCLLFLLFFFFLILLLYKINVKQNSFITKEHQLKSQFAQTLLQSQIEIQEQTLQHLSRELHDNLGQVASLIKINLNTLQLNDQQKLVAKIEDTKELTRQLIADIKSMSVSLGSDRIEQAGLVAVIETEVERLNKTGEFFARLEVTGSTPWIDKDRAVILYRMTQEVLNNIIKHSRARNISIVVHNTILAFTLSITDDGIGFNTSDLSTESGAGLYNLKNRAALINATLQVQSAPGAGTKIFIDLPL